MNERFNPHLSRPRYVASFILMLLLVAVGYFSRPLLSEGFKSASLYIFLGLIIFLAILGVSSYFGEKRYIKKHTENIQVRDRHEDFNRRKELALSDLAAAKGRVARLRLLNVLYGAFLFFCSLAVSYLIGASGYWFLFMLTIPVFFCVMLVALQRITPLYAKYDFTDYTEEKDFPLIYAVARKAAKTVDVDGEIKIQLLTDCNAGIARFGGVISLQIGTILLDLMTEEELYQILLHEFGHMAKSGQISQADISLNEKISTLRGLNNLSRKIIGALFSYPDVLFSREFYFYRITASQALEIIADETERKYGDPQLIVSSLAKINMYDLFSHELYNFDEPIYAPEKMRSDYSQSLISKFRKVLPERHDIWKNLLMNEIQPRSASHPIFRARMEAMGVSDFTVTLPDGSSDYRKECKIATAKADKQLFDRSNAEYDKIRKTEYLKHLDVIESWERKGKPITDESSRPILEALWKLHRFEEVEALCDDIIANNKNRAATAHSRLLKGIILAMRYDKDFLGYIYDAIDINSNYVEEGLQVIGEYCCKMGLQKELEEYRERSVVIAQSNIDEFSKLHDLLPTDNVVQDDMSKEMLDSILKYFESISENSISRIYLVKKVINENFFGSCFIIRFKEGSPEAVVMRVMDKIFNHLDTHESERQFSLFYYGPNYADIIARVENSCVWDIADKM